MGTLKNKMRPTLIVMAVSIYLHAAAQVQDGMPIQSRVDVDPIPAVTVKAGQTAPVVFTFHILPGFHVNSNKPITPELIPTQLSFSLPGELVIAKLLYPAGQLTGFPFDPSEKLSVYSGTVTVKGTVIAEPKASVGPYTVHGELKYQACDNNACYPPKKLPIEFIVKVAKARPRAAHGNAQSPNIHY